MHCLFGPAMPMLLCLALPDLPYGAVGSALHLSCYALLLYYLLIFFYPIKLPCPAVPCLIPPCHSSDFNETTKIFFWSWTTSGKMFYDADQNAELVHRENGRGDRYGLCLMHAVHLSFLAFAVWCNMSTADSMDLCSNM